MNDVLKECIEEFIDKRLNQICIEISSCSSEYSRFKKSIMMIEEEFLKNDNEKLQKLFTDYENTLKRQCSLLTKEAYNKGFTDAIEIFSKFKDIK